MIRESVLNKSKKVILIFPALLKLLNRFRFVDLLSMPRVDYDPPPVSGKQKLMGQGAGPK